MSYIRKPRHTTRRIRRLCLRCDQLFRSNGPANRICALCHTRMAEQPTPEETYEIVRDLDHDLS